MTTNIDRQSHDRTALVLYGSETGTAQDVADELGRMLERLRFRTHVLAMNSVEIVYTPRRAMITETDWQCSEFSISVQLGYLRHLDHRTGRPSC